MILNFQKLRSNAILPTRATAQSAGLDLYACLPEPCKIPPHSFQMIPTGVACEPSDLNVSLLIFARSGLACKYGVALTNGVGVVDADYRGEIYVSLINQSDKEFIVTDGMRIAQLVTVPIIYPETNSTNELKETERGDGGFGSTGLN